MIKRNIEPVLRQMADHFKAVTITGPRQSGKTTLSRMVFPDKPRQGRRVSRPATVRLHRGAVNRLFPEIIKLFTGNTGDLAIEDQLACRVAHRIDVVGKSVSGTGKKRLPIVGWSAIVPCVVHAGIINSFSVIKLL